MKMFGRTRRWVALVCAGGVIAFAAIASAAGDDRALAETTLKEVEASPKKDVANELTSRAHAALDRGAKLRSSGDEAHAKIADAVARTWAEAARDVVRSVTTEESASGARRNATDAGAFSDRERALLEEAIAQSGRLRAQLDAAEQNKADNTPRTSAAANTPEGPVTAKDGGAAKPAPAPKPARDRDAGAATPRGAR